MFYRNSALADGLAARGHNVTFIAPDIVKDPPKGVHQIYLEGVYNDEYRALQKGLFNVTELMSPLVEPVNYNGYWYWSCKGNRLLLSDIVLNWRKKK